LTATFEKDTKEGTPDKIEVALSSSQLTGKIQGAGWEDEIWFRRLSEIESLVKVVAQAK
jgi:hypothetical protein